MKSAETYPTSLNLLAAECSYRNFGNCIPSLFVDHSQLSVDQAFECITGISPHNRAVLTEYGIDAPLNPTPMNDD